MLLSPNISITGGQGALGKVLGALAEDLGLRVSSIDLTTARSGESFIDRVDLSTERDARQAMQLAANLRGPIHALCNLCGSFESRSVMDSTPALWTALFRENFLTTFNACRAAVPLMQDGGMIINVGATAGFRAGAGMGSYSAAKAGVMRLSEALDAELGGHGVRVRCLLPAVLDTPRNRRDMPDADWRTWESLDKVAARMLVMAGLATGDAGLTLQHL